MPGGDAGPDRVSQEEDLDDVQMEVQDQGHDSDVVIQVDINSIAERYPIVKARMREVHFVTLCRCCVVLIGVDWIVVQADGRAGVESVGASELSAGSL
jgi:hypothetical protein